MGGYVLNMRSFWTGVIIATAVALLVFTSPGRPEALFIGPAALIWMVWQW